MDNDTPPSELYLITPENFKLDEFKDIFQSMAQEIPISCLQIRMPDASEQDHKAAIDALAPIAWDKDIAVLLCDEAELVKELNLDGVHLEYDTSQTNVIKARNIIGEERSLGVSCGNSKHTAMLAGESGADYVTFGPLFPFALDGIPADEAVLEALSWWAVMMELPCVATGGLSVGNIDLALQTNAEFIAPTTGIWDHELGPLKAAKLFYDAALTYRSTQG